MFFNTCCSSTLLRSSRMHLQTRNPNSAFAAIGDPTLAANMGSSSTQFTIPALNLYIYRPSQFLAILFTITYSILIPLYIYLCFILPRRQTLRNPSPTEQHRYTISLLLASIISTTGYAIRITSVQPRNLANITLYAISNSHIIISPILICATLYLLLISLIRRCLPSKALGVKINTQKFLGISPKWLAGIFISSDILSFLMQGAGSAIEASGSHNGKLKDMGTHVLLVGLALQLVSFVALLSVLGQFCLRLRKSNTGRELRGEWNVIGGMWLASGFVLVRSVFRVFEFGMGINGYLFQHEWTLYVFDATPVWIALLVLAYWHPVRWLIGTVEPEMVIAYSPVGNGRNQFR